jgi:hypothetical protein
MRRGELESRREVVPQGFRWLVPLPDAPQGRSDAPGRAERGHHGSDIIAVHEHDTAALIETLRQELATRNQEINLLHDIIATQAQAIERTAALAQGGPVEEPAQASPAPTSEPTDRPGVLDRLRRWIRGGAT